MAKKESEETKEETKVEETKAEKSKSSKKKKKPEPVSYVYIDEFFAARQISPGVAAAFRVYMKGRTYQLSVKAFEKEFKAFLERKV